MRPGELLVDDKSRDGSHTLELAGELDIATAPDLEATILSLCVDGVGEIVLDLSKLELVDSADCARSSPAKRCVRNMAASSS